VPRPATAREQHYGRQPTLPARGAGLLGHPSRPVVRAGGRPCGGGGLRPVGSGRGPPNRGGHGPPHLPWDCLCRPCPPFCGDCFPYWTRRRWTFPYRTPPSAYAPSRAGSGVFDVDAGVAQRVAHIVGPLKLAVLPGTGAFVDELLD